MIGHMSAPQIERVSRFVEDAIQKFYCPTRVAKTPPLTQCCHFYSIDILIYSVVLSDNITGKGFNQYYGKQQNFY